MTYVAPGDIIEVVTKRGQFKGRLMPSPDKNSIILKLENGYNIGIEKSKIKEKKVIEKYKGKKKPVFDKIKAPHTLTHISILHTGGTIASAVDYETGGVISRISPEELLDMVPELSFIANIKSRLIRNMASDDMRFAHYNIMAKDIKKEVENGADGIIITHGTDTMHYTAAALAFMLENLPVPVILVGSQRSSDRGSSDFIMNIICAAEFISKTDFAEVGICMHGSSSDKFCYVLPACKARKMHTSRRDTFRPINASPWAKIDYLSRKVELKRKNYNKREKEAKIELKLMKEKIKVGIIKAHPNMYSSEFEAYKGFEGLVIEGTGLGHAPLSEIDEFTKEHKKIFNAIKKLNDNGTVIVMAPQTIYGRLQMDVYVGGRRIQSIGVLGNNCDMTPETAFIKLSWLLSNYPKDKVKELIGQNLKGEINERILETEFLN